MATVVDRERRTLKFASLADIVSEAEKWGAGTYETAGNWSCGQILYHLASAMHASFDGFGFQAPWILRLAAPLFKKPILTKPMKPGFKLPNKAVSMIPADEVSIEEGLESLRNGVVRYETEIPNQPHPVFGLMSSEEWQALHLRHAEMHMSFARPRET